LALALACTSCDRQRLYPVAGEVRFMGAPAAGAAVFFKRRGADPLNEPMIMGIVREDGSFALVTGSLGQGAPLGEYDVLVEWRQSLSSRAKGISTIHPDRLKGVYADPRHPQLHAAVEAKANQLPVFELESKAPSRKR
jgi:hypothetical protein